MKMKKFEAGSMKEALEKVKEEMGPDAFILNTRQITKKGPLGFGDRKFLQVTAAIEEEDLAKDKKAKAAKAAAAAPGLGIDIRQEGESGFTPVEPAGAPVTTYTPTGRTTSTATQAPGKSFTDGFETVFAAARSGLDESAAKGRKRADNADGGRPLRQELDELKTMVAGLGGQGPDLTPLQRELGELKHLLYNVIRSQTPIFGKSLTPTLLSHYQKLKDSGVDESVAAKLIHLTDDKLEPEHKDNGKKVLAYLRALIRKSIDVRERGKGAKIQALVGPTGVGKTTTLAKLAANAALQEHKKVVLITLDTFRIAAVEQLKTYAKIMELPVQVALNLSELRQAIQFHQDADLILVDTPGHSQKDRVGMETLEAFLSDQGDIDVHLVLSATTKSSDLSDIVERFATLKPGYLIFSKLDETTNYGPLFNQIVKTRMPVSYLTTGQNVPEDFEPATADTLADLLIGKNLELLKGGSP